MGRPDPRFLVVGHLNKPHGTKGEFVIWLLTDHPEGSFAPGVVLRLGSGESDGPDPDLPPLTVEHARPFRQGYLVRFSGVDDRDQAERFRGHYLFREAAALEPLADGELFFHQLLGLEVWTLGGAKIGEVTEVYEAQPGDLLEVQAEDRKLVIPFLKHIVVELDTESGRIVIDPPDGLLDL